MPFSYERTIHFADTDAAGVVFFANYLRICHEAYEEALHEAGIELSSFFSDTGVVVPVSKSEAEYLRPLRCGDKVKVDLRPERLAPDRFAIHFELTLLGKLEKTAAKVRTEHICVSTTKRERAPLPLGLGAWVDHANR